MKANSKEILPFAVLIIDYIFFKFQRTSSLDVCKCGYIIFSKSLYDSILRMNLTKGIKWPLVYKELTILSTLLININRTKRKRKGSNKRAKNHNENYNMIFFIYM